MRWSLLLALLVAPLLLAQESPQPFSEEIEVRVIDVDVVVTDRAGRPITNLTRDDFELYEDGKRVDIAYFSRFVDGRSAEEPAQAAQPGVTTEPPRAPVTWIVYLDQTNIQPSRRNVALRQLRTFFERTLPAGERAMFASNDGMAMRIKQTLTGDRKLLLDALTVVEKERFYRSPTAAAATEIRTQIRNADSGDREFEYLRGNIANQINILIHEEANRTRNAINAMRALMDAIQRIEGRVALVYVGAGFNSLPAQDLTDAWIQRFGRDGAPRPEEEKRWIEEEVTRLYTSLSATRIAVYTVHSGDSWMPGGEDAGSVFTPPGGFQDDGIPGDRARMTEAGLAREMAQRTGGLYFALNTALATKLDAMRSDLSNYYSLGYKPTGPPGDARRVRVKVKTEAARVRHRETVREPSRQERAGRAAVAAVLQPQRTPAVAMRAPVAPTTDPSAANPLGVSIEAAAPQRDGWTLNHLLPFRFALQLEALTFRPVGNVHRADFVMHFALVAPDGTIWPVESRDHKLEIPQSEAPQQGQHVNYNWHVDLSPLKIPAKIPVKDDMKLMVTVEDRVSKLRSVITSPLGKR